MNFKDLPRTIRERAKALPLSPEQKRHALITLYFIFFLVLCYGGLKPSVTAYVHANQTLTTLQRKLEINEVQVRTLTKLRARLAVLRQKTEILSKGISNSEDQVACYQEVAALSRQANLTVQNLTRAKTTLIEDAPLTKFSLKLTSLGTYASLIQFLQALQESDILFTAEDLRVTPSESPLLRMELILSTYGT